MKRIVPCLDVRDGRVVKGVRFANIKDVSSPVELARFYCGEGADELVFYDITASRERRALFMDTLKAVAECVTIPFMVGGGIGAIDDFDRVIDAGADKVSINSGAIRDPNLIEAAAKKHGSKRVVLAMDVKLEDGRYAVYSDGYTKKAEFDALEWARRGQELGAGELVVNSIDTDGVKEGFDLPMLAALLDVVSIPIVASGGAGGIQDFVKLFKTLPGIDAGLAASIFHYRETSIMAVKQELQANGIPVKI
ncbi:MAG: imidazole glycerol phosphate synthase cyclase subunit [Oscillospiraceae bacterium]|nr:imidazole glycerol phosphate synthase cyclase subunit [Oscillospiraceae bacterium]